MEVLQARLELSVVHPLLPPLKIKIWTPAVTVACISRCPCVTSCLPVQDVVGGGVPACVFGLFTLILLIHAGIADCFHHQAFTGPHSRRANHIISISFYFIYSLLPFSRLLSSLDLLTN